MCRWVRAKLICVHEPGINWRTGNKGRSGLNANWLKGSIWGLSKIKQTINWRGGCFMHLCYLFTSTFLDVHHALHISIGIGIWLVCDLCYGNTPLPSLHLKREIPRWIFLDVPEMLLMTHWLHICFHRKSWLSCSCILSWISRDLIFIFSPSSDQFLL